jgi:hypothetical protein
MSIDYIHTPWLAGKEVLKSTKLELGRDYPIVDHANARLKALSAWRQIKQNDKK